MRPNRLRQKLNAGEPTIGTHILSSWPTLVELIGDAENYDYVEFTAEYAPFAIRGIAGAPNRLIAISPAYSRPLRKSVRIRCYRTRYQRNSVLRGIFSGTKGISSIGATWPTETLASSPSCTSACIELSASARHLDCEMALQLGQNAKNSVIYLALQDLRFVLDGHGGDARPTAAMAA